MAGLRFALANLRSNPEGHIDNLNRSLKRGLFSRPVENYANFFQGNQSAAQHEGAEKAHGQTNAPLRGIGKMVERELPHAAQQEAADQVHHQSSAGKPRAGAILHQPLEPVARQRSGDSKKNQQSNLQVASSFRPCSRPTKKLLGAQQRPGVISPAERDGFGELHRLEGRIIHNPPLPAKAIPAHRRASWGIEFPLLGALRWTRPPCDRASFLERDACPPLWPR